jgi:hypothetical protein
MVNDITTMDDESIHSLQEDEEMTHLTNITNSYMVPLLQDINPGIPTLDRQLID